VILLSVGGTIVGGCRLKGLKWRTGQFADKSTCHQSSRRVDNSWTNQLADSEFLIIMELLYFICTLNLTQTLTLTLLNIGSV